MIENNDKYLIIKILFIKITIKKKNTNVKNISANFFIRNYYEKPLIYITLFSKKFILILAKKIFLL